MQKSTLKLLQFALLFSVFTFIGCGDDEDPAPTITAEIFPGQGLTDIKIGDTGQQVFDAYGTVADSYFGFNGTYTHFLLYLSEGLNFYLEQNDSENLDLSKKVTHIDITEPFKGKTEEGIGVGSTMTEVKAAYGEPDNESTSFGAIKATYNSGIVFEYDDQGNETVVTITIE